MSSTNPFIEELRWRGMLQDMTPGVIDQLNKEITTGYAGFDPTADSLGIGNLVPVMLLKRLQLHGHKPIALVGGATGMIGDPSGKSAERNLLSEDVLRHNVESQRKQLERFLDFNSGANGAEIVNNYDWFKDIGYLQFLRDVGKHITIAYMLSKESVQNRMESGISYTEFSYQLLQGYDFTVLHKTKNCKLQLGGSDQWGNMVTGTELVRRIAGGDAHAVTCPLVTKADGTKFGKTESGNIFLSAERTSPYKFYQFWLNAADADAGRYMRIFTLLAKDEIELIETQHTSAPHQRALQRTLAQEVTRMVHGPEELTFAVEASEILFGSATTDALARYTPRQIESVFEGIPSAKVAKSDFEQGIDAVILFSDKTGFMPSRGEAKRTLQGKGARVNKRVIENVDAKVTSEALINQRYLLLQKGKKDFFLVIAE